ncbi:MAG: extracellular solute-binding protein [Treponema sp.]|jgi:raffinose/stachyose/melibiose transport system substrate-binding protein|nr:extracellular solute-binding protein [Treponema sp.]
MRKLRIASVILAVLAAISVMTSCSKKDNAAGKTAVSVLNYADMTVANTAADQKWTWDTFKSKNSSVNLVIEDLFNEPFHQKTEAYAASGNLPDVLYVWPSGRSTSLHQNKLLKDLAPLIAKDNLKGSYSPIAMDPSQQASNYQAMIPLTMTASHAFYVNMEVLNDCGLQPAKTYNELKAQVAVLKAKGYETVIMPNKDTWVMQSCLFSAVAGRFGGADWHEKILNGQAKFTDPEFVNALNFIATMYRDGVIAQSSLGMDYGDGPGLFATNKGAYYIDGDWRVGAFITDASTGQALISPDRQVNFLMTVFPDIEGAKLNKSTSVILGTGWAMSAAIEAGSAKEDAAWRLIKWLTGVEVQTLGVEHAAYSTAANMGVDVGKLSLEPIQKSAGNLGKEYSTGTCVIDGVFHSDVYTPINDGLQEIGLGTKTGQQIAADTQRVFDSGRTAGTW